jgi:hypothetical protein
MRPGSRHSLLAAVTSALLVAACGGSPTEVYYNMATAAEFGDRTGFLEAFTPDSRQLIEAQISLTEAYGLRRDNPVAMFVFPQVDGSEESGDDIILTVSRGSTTRRILFVKTDGGWKIDLKKLARFQADERRRR